jgi:hypothetical protein
MGILRDTSDDDGLGLGPTRTVPVGALLTSSPPEAGAGARGSAGDGLQGSAGNGMQGGGGTVPAHAGDAQPSAVPSGPPTPGAADSTELERRHETLAAQVTELHWDLGGLAYEMAIRDHFRLDVLVRRAALLQERDAELAEVERLLRMEHDGVAGACPQCSAPHSRGAVFCWQCGMELMQRLPSSSGTIDE